MKESQDIAKKDGANSRPLERDVKCEICITCKGVLTKRSPLYDQGICLYCVRLDTRMGAYQSRLRRRGRYGSH
jgi:hypothetical protein